MITIQPYVHYPCNLIAQTNSRHQDYFLTSLAPVESWLTLRGPTARHSRSWHQFAHVATEIEWTPKRMTILKDIARAQHHPKCIWKTNQKHHRYI